MNRLIDSTTLIVHLRVVGVLMAFLVVINLIVPKRLAWSEELSRVSLANRQVFEVHMLFIVLLVALLALLLVTCADALLEPTKLARAMLLGLTVFWGARMLCQWFYYSPKLWRGDRFNTTVHVVFSATWVYFTATFAAALWHSFSVVR